MSIGLAIFVKTPGYSPIKTRLAADCGEAYAQAWYRHAATAVGAVVRAAKTRHRFSPYWAVAEADAIEHRAWPGMPMLDQGEGDLGARLARIHTTLVELHGAGVVIGADAPQVSAELLGEAAEWLRASEPRLVMGPARDGGFWLFGGNRSVPIEAWESVRYSTPDAGHALHTALEHRGHWHSLPLLTDVDTGADLALALQELVLLTERVPEQEVLVEWMRRTEVSPA